MEEALTDHRLRLLVDEIRLSFERLQRQLAAQPAEDETQPETTSETELESFVRQARLEQAKAASPKHRRLL